MEILPEIILLVTLSRDITIVAPLSKVRDTFGKSSPSS
jgi:hypothetical protein